MKAEKGITLVALVITIIVLLILAMLSISIFTNHDVIQYANNATTSYNEAQTQEKTQLNQAAEEMEKYNPTKASE